MLKNNLFATNYKQRWSIRKLTIGVVSVFIGGTILLINSSHTVIADSSEPKIESASNQGGGILTDNSTNHGEENSTASAADDTEKTTVANVDNDTIKVSTSNIVGNTVEKTAHPEVTKTNVQVNSSPVINNNNKGGVLAKQNHSQATASQYQPKESDERKEESSKANYYAIFREVTIIKPDGTEVVLPYQVLGSIYFNSDEKENDQLPKLGFKALEAPPIEGYNSPVIPAISVSISDFLNNDITDPTYDDHLYDGHHPIQRQSLDVVGLPDDTKYDDDYDRFSDEFDEKYKDKYGLSDNDFEALLIKEEYFYKKKEDPKPIEGKEEKTITRTINVHLPNGEVQTTKQPVTLERTYTSVAGSDKKEYGPWNTGQWDAFSAPKLDGYTALLASVDAAEVTSDSLDAVVDIYYRANEPVLPETPTIPIDPTKPINPPTTPGKPIEPPTNPITPGNATIGSESGIISNKVATNSKVTSQNVDNKNAQEKLPQTGDKEITIYSILGLILTSFLGAWSFIRKR